MKLIVENNLVLLSLVFFVKVIQQKEVIKILQKMRFCYHKTGGLCTSEIKKILCVNKV